MTVLFADLKGSMELLADRDPEEARKLLDPVLERMMHAVHRYEGIMALFGTLALTGSRYEPGLQAFSDAFRSFRIVTTHPLRTTAPHNAGT